LRALGLKERGCPGARCARLARVLSLLGLVAVAASSPPASSDDGRVVHMRLDGMEYTLGHADAPVTMVEFTDYQCPYCRRFEAETWPRLKHEYVDTGKVRFIVRDLPLPFHVNARQAAEAAHCAGEQGHFWPMHDVLLAGTTGLDLASLVQQAQGMGLDVGRFRDCVTTNKYDAAIARNVATARALGLRGTPGFVLGRMTHGELEGIRFFGALPYDNFANVINALLAARERTPS
jgi:protein-disulfide isomerase